jgi:hypothetical protein
MMLVMMLWYYDNGSPREYKIYNKSPPKRRRVASVVCLQTIFVTPSVCLCLLGAGGKPAVRKNKQRREEWRVVW